jgi:hypothetical protein
MSLNEATVEDAALEWFLLRQGCGGQVGALGYAIGHGQIRRDERGWVRQLFVSVPPEKAEAAPCGTASLLLQLVVDELG